MFRFEVNVKGPSGEDVCDFRVLDPRRRGSSRCVSDSAFVVVVPFA